MLKICDICDKEFLSSKPFFSPAHEGIENCDKCSYKLSTRKRLKITLIENIQEKRFTIIIVRKLLKGRVVQLSSSGTNAH